jgi:drug/metabolite transporter (DMT)-like permease
MEIKSIAIIFPLLAAVSWALTYAINGRNYEYLTVPTGLVLMGTAAFIAAFAVSFILKSPIDLSPLFKNNDIWLWMGLVAAIFASTFLHLSLRYTSATYAALGESAYLVLIPIFTFLLFGQKQWNNSIIIGGAFVLLGLYFVVSGQLQKSPPPGG